jgi:hypothetical protein
MPDLDRIGGVPLDQPSEEDQVATLQRALGEADGHRQLLVQAIREHQGVRSSMASDLDHRLYEFADRVAAEAGIVTPDERESRDG